MNPRDPVWGQDASLQQDCLLQSLLSLLLGFLIENVFYHIVRW